MSYVDTHRELTGAFQEGRASGPLDAGLVLHPRRFRSEEAEARARLGASGGPPEPEAFQGRLERDADVEENLDFPYRVLAPPGCTRGTRGVVLLHGLNERRWEKYLTWGKALVDGLGVPVILFPIAFHMERSPALWSDPRAMRQLSRERLRLLPGLEASSFANAALSTRLHSHPERFLWAGLRTLRDLSRLSDLVRRGEEPLLDPEARLDLFAYSIGAFLAQVLLMADEGGRFTHSRLVSFCGGCVLSQTVPLAREILDSAAAGALHRFFEELEAEKQRHPELARRLAEGPAGRAFESLVAPERYPAEREAALRRVGPRLSAIALGGDQVMPAGAVAATLAGSGARFERLDPPYRYDHANPFPLQGVDAAEVQRAFTTVFERSVKWLGARD